MFGDFQGYKDKILAWLIGEGWAFRDRAGVVLRRAGKAILSLALSAYISYHGVYTVVCVDRAGTFRWADLAYNSVTNAGLNSNLNVYFTSATQITTWYLGLVDNTSFTAFAPTTDTMASHGGWIEVTAYAATTRPSWGPAASTAQSLSNASTVNFAINASKTVKGLFLVSDNTKSGTTGVLFSEAPFASGNQTVNNGDTLQVTYTLSSATT